MIQRKLICSEDYRGYQIHVKYMGPDLLAYVGEEELPGFYLDSQAALAAGKRYVDDKIREEIKSKKGALH